MSDYPSASELHKIRNWNGTFRELWEYVASLWSYPEWGVVEDFNGEVYKLELHTAGWSGNEDIIEAFRKSKCMFFYMYHTKWERGGHYYFEVYPNTWNVLLTTKEVE